MPLPPTIDEAIRLIRSHHGSVTVGQLADAVVNHGWEVDRDELIERIRTLFPGRTASVAGPRTDKSPRSEREKVGRGPRATSKKRTKPRRSQVYCPRCHTFVIVTHDDGASMIEPHLTKKGAKCPRGGKAYVKPRKRDAMEFRAPGSFGSGKRR